VEGGAKVDEAADVMPDVITGSLLRHARPVLDLGERVFDRVEIGRVGRQDRSPIPADSMICRNTVDL
jgi:hypothetical protein